jgi:hypothetical protein
LFHRRSRAGFGGVEGREEGSFLFFGGVGKGESPLPIGESGGRFVPRTNLKAAAPVGRGAYL